LTRQSDWAFSVLTPGLRRAAQAGGDVVEVGVARGDPDDQVIVVVVRSIEEADVANRWWVPADVAERSGDPHRLERGDDHP
jgi:hypothetical protein